MTFVEISVLESLCFHFDAVSTVKAGFCWRTNLYQSVNKEDGKKF